MSERAHPAVEPLEAEPTIRESEFTERLHDFHRSAYASDQASFDRVMRRFYQPEPGWVAQDHCLVHDGRQWHLYVLTAPLSEAEPLVRAVRARDWQEAKRHPYVIGESHLAGSTLFSLSPRGRILDTPQGEFAMLCQAVSSIHPVGERWVDVYTASGPKGQGLCVAWSRDLERWEMESSNPLWRPPQGYAAGTTVCKAAFIVPHQGRYLVYYNLNLPEGTSTVSLLSTRDFLRFTDHGPVVKMPFQFRGTQGVESPCVFLREGMWHLVVGSGEGFWHFVSNRPDRFMNTQGISSASVQGAYCLGPFHACKVLEHHGRWLMSSTYKEEHRRQCRVAGKRTFRGESADEAGMLQGLFLSEIRWEGDFPVLEPPGVEL